MKTTTSDFQVDCLKIGSRLMHLMWRGSTATED